MGNTVTIRLNDEQLARVEESAALAGYKHRSTYMRDRVLEPSKVDSHQGGIDQWADQQRILSLLESLDQAQATNRTILASWSTCCDRTARKESSTSCAPNYPHWGAARKH